MRRNLTMDIYDNSSEISSIAKASLMTMFLIGMPSKRYVCIMYILADKILLWNFQFHEIFCKKAASWHIMTDRVPATCVSGFWILMCCGWRNGEVEQGLFFNFCQIFVKCICIWLFISKVEHFEKSSQIQLIHVPKMKKGWFIGRFDYFSKQIVLWVESAAKIWKIITNAKYLAKNEEEPCLPCLKTIYRLIPG